MLTLATLIPVLATPLVALAVNAGVSTLLRKRRKELRVRIGKREIAITVPATASDEEVASAVERHLHLEESVKSALEQWLRGHQDASFRDGVHADFLVSSADRKVAVEVEASLADVNVPELVRLLDLEGANALLVVSPVGQEPPSELAAEVGELPPHLEFVRIPLTGGSGTQLRAALDRILPASAIA